MRALIGSVSRMEIADDMHCAIDGDTVRVTHGPTPDDCATMHARLGAAQEKLSAATQRAASLAEQLAAAEQALTTATRERNAAVSVLASTSAVLGGLRGHLYELASGGSLPVGNALDHAQGSAVADALRTLARRVDPQPAHGGASGGAGVDVAAISGSARMCVKGTADHYGAEQRHYGATILANAIHNELVFARPPQGSADERGQAVEREAKVVRVVIGEGAISRDGWRGMTGTNGYLSLHLGRLAALADHQGQKARLLVEVVAHPANVSPSVGSGKGPQS